ncbi:MAG: response regulator transcription factor [Alphaproteobacteria bacterium]|nr:response regulator transcription factor [Alphaproteobacteria bacterium]
MNLKKVTVLSVDDDKNLQFVLHEFLEGEGYDVQEAYSGKDLGDQIANSSFDVILLDLMLPDAQGLGLITTIRTKTKTPIIIVSGKTDTTEKIVGLEMGADDYITKPFEMRELSARIRAVLRRAASNDEPKAAAGDTQTKDKLQFDGWVLDRTQYQAFSANGSSMNLTTGEFKLLEALALSCNRAISREQLYDMTRQEDYDSYDRAIDIQIARIRKKMGDDTKSPSLIKTIRGVGYMLCAEQKTV